MKILAVGDVAGSSGVSFLKKNLRRIKAKHNADIVIVNAENSADTNGINAASAQAVFDAGADVITGGNHSFHHRDIFSYMESHPELLRPLNLTDAPDRGNGYIITDTFEGRMMTVSLMGQTFMGPADSPFTAFEALLKREKGCYDFVVVDFHAEATSEKLAFAHHFADRVAVIFGTHTHVQTADERLIGTCAYITDIGMCGAYDSILGAKKEVIINRFMTRVPERFAMATGEARLCGALFEVDGAGRATRVTRITEE